MVDWKVESWVSQCIFTWSPKPYSTCGYLSLICSNSFSYPNTPKTVLLQKLSNLYKRTSTDIMFQQYDKAFKSSQSRDVTFFVRSTSLNCLTPTQDLNFLKRRFVGRIKISTKKLPIGYQCANDRDRWRGDITA